MPPSNPQSVGFLIKAVVCVAETLVRVRVRVRRWPIRY